MLVSIYLYVQKNTLKPESSTQDQSEDIIDKVKAAPLGIYNATTLPPKAAWGTGKSWSTGAT